MTHTTTQETSLISGGSATIFVSNVARAVAFYTETLGLKLAYQAGDFVHPGFGHKAIRGRPDVQARQRRYWARGGEVGEQPESGCQGIGAGHPEGLPQETDGIPIGR